MQENILEVKNLSVQFNADLGVVKAVNEVSFSLKQGEVLGIVGETGCGKTMTALSILRLVPSPGEITKGEILFKGENLLKKSEREMQDIRGAQISLVFQEPASALNPVFTIGDQIAEVIQRHKKTNKKQALQKTIELLKKVKIPEPEKRLKNYPHQFSGGMCQRVVIAMALACSPAVLIADEPTTSLDVTIQAEIIELMKELQKGYNSAIILITHNLGIVAQMCQKVLVMYSGTVVEISSADKLFKQPKHPYTQMLLKSVPRIDEKLRTRLQLIGGHLPDLSVDLKGCLFYARCKMAKEICREKQPILQELPDSGSVRCWLY